MPHVPFSAVLRHHAARKSPNAPAVSHEGVSMGWAELDARSNQRARLLASLGVAHGDFVSFALPNGIEFFETSFAIWKLGAVPNPVAPKMPALELANIVELVKPALFIGDTPTNAKKQIGLSAPLESFSTAALDEPVGPYSEAIASGGSTGRPKVIVHHNPPEIDPDIVLVGLRADGVALNPGPLYHNAPFVMMHRALGMGCHVVNMSRFDAEEALRLIDEHRVTYVNFVPTMMHRIWSLPQDTRERFDVSSLETVFHMASAMPVWLKEKWIEWLGPDVIWELYGGTERQGHTIIGGRDWLAKRGSVGKVSPGAQLAIFDEHGKSCAAGEVGEIYFRTEASRGTPYHYIGSEAKALGDGWESLGDIGWLDEDGFLFLADRRTDLIVRGGANIYPAEVECALDEHPDVASSIVIGLPDEDLGQQVHALVEIRSQSRTALQPNDLRAFLSDRLAKYKLPTSFEFVDHPLRDDAGKARRSKLRDERIAWIKENKNFATQ